MKVALFIYVIAYSLVPVNMNSIPLVSIPPIQLYVGDLLSALAIIACGWGILSWNRELSRSEYTPYFLFLLWLIISILLGIGKYGYRAYGESRTIMHFFTFFFPFAVIRNNGETTQREIERLTKQIVVVSGICALAVLLFGGGLGIAETDYRGIRYLNSNQTFFLMMCGILYLLTSSSDGTGEARPLTAGVFLMAAVLSKNRTALVSLGAVGGLYFLLQRRFKVMIITVLIALVFIAGVAYVDSSTGKQIAVSLEGVANPTADQDYAWRLLVQGAAIEQGMETFWMGQGYGSYFNFEVEEEGNIHTEVETPHNQYLSIFLKTGIIGVGLMLAGFGWLIVVALARMRSRNRSSTPSSVYILLILAAASQFLYGFGYDFHALFGIYLGLLALQMRFLVRSSEQDPGSQDPIAFQL
jgi:O-antigen ligase